MPDIGDELIYRLRVYEPSQHVKVVEIDNSKKTPRYVVEFLEGNNAGTRANVPGSRLHGPWADVEQFDWRMAQWEKFEDVELTETETDAMCEVFCLLIPETIAQWDWSYVHWSVQVLDELGLEQRIGVSVDDVLDQVAGFKEDGGVMLSPEGGLLIAQYACRINPMPVLAWVDQDEKEYRDKCRNGHLGVGPDNRPHRTDPQWEYQWYLEHGRPLHELLRCWCGQRAVTMHERLGAAEAENHRLEELLEQLFRQMEQHGFAQSVEYLKRKYEEERITPYNYRTSVDRPLRPEEIPVRVEYRRAPRWWGY
ncbi:hypothetical protein [Bifidobacterium callitrichidarum]|uniref:hypothetical protein n=1 Tax=Bifidobacterium callitrichidarum TaxID=2052941 RepID=UPI0011B27E27|nr:hypothetical protein [Bifidobacterium callitrichidarum]